MLSVRSFSAMKTLDNTALIVLGMHRSGTSVLTGALNLLGVPLGSSLMAAQADNVGGFWEHDEVVKVHDRLLAAFDSTWDDVCPLPARWWLTREARAFQHELSAILVREFSGEKLWALKDPRMCRLLPLWMPLLEELHTEPVFILATRSPLEIARSLAARNQMSGEKAMLLWLEHSIPAELETRDKCRIVISYDQLLMDAAGTLERIGKNTGVTYPRSVSISKEPLDEFIQPGRRHHCAAGDGDYLSEHVREAYSAMQAGAAGKEAEMRHRLTEIYQNWQASRQLYLPLLRRDALVQRVNHLEAALAAQSDLSREFISRFHATERRLRKRDAQIAELKAKRERDRTKLTTTKEKLRVMEASRAWKLVRPFAKSTRQTIQTDKQVPANPSLAKPQPPSVDARTIQFPVRDNIEVSIIIPVHNNLAYTLACLKSLAQNDDARRIEVIVIDDGSTDGTHETLSALQGVQYLRNETSVGFVGSCNRGAQAARGEYVLFLNNDTEVTAGWLSGLIETFRTRANVGMAGSKLVYPDGRLQEAGGLIFNDASGANIGKLGDPDDPEYNYLREVDYCSGASLMIPRALFHELGTFDERYAPCYYEDTDLAFKVRDRGLKVFYQPFSRVIHYEGATAGTDVEGGGSKKHQDTNRLIFFSRWASTLAKFPPPGADRRRERKILVVDEYLPAFDRDSGSLRMFNLLRILCELGYSVTFIPSRFQTSSSYSSELQKRGVRVLLPPRVASVEDYLKKEGDTWEAVILSRLAVARLLLDVAHHYAPTARLIYDTVDLHFLRLSREAELKEDPEARKQAALLKAEELHLIRGANETWVVTPRKSKWSRRNCPTRRCRWSRISTISTARPRLSRNGPGCCLSAGSSTRPMRMRRIGSSRKFTPW